jgi:Mrp family chromosome partitioning ATPase
MSKFDQAFFKAYGQGSSPSRAKASEPKSELIRLSEALDRYSAPRVATEFDAAPELVETQPAREAVVPDLQPMLQVDAFAWPAALAASTPAAEAGFDAVADALVEPSGRGPTVIALAGTAGESGCTTLLLGAARRLAQRGASVVLVDANEMKPDLAAQLGLLPTLGWEDVASGQQPLAEALIESIGDRMTLLPLCRAEGLAAVGDTAVASSRMAAAMAALRRQYDLVLVDLGSPGKWVTRAVDDAVDAAVLVHHVRRATPDDLRTAVEQLTARGIACAGVIENFARPQTSASCRRAA